MDYLRVFFIVICSCTFINAYKILAIFPMPAYSHYLLSEKILKELVKRGHELTVINPYPQKTPITNFTDISIESIVDVVTERKKNLYNLESQSIAHSIEFITRFGLMITELSLKHENVQKLLNSDQQFDLILMAQFLDEAYMGFQHKFKAPVIQISGMPPFVWNSFILSHPSPSSYVPNNLSSFTAKMNFWQRCLNSFYDLYAILYYQWLILPKHKELARKYIPGSPNLDDFISNVSLVFINSHPSIYDVVPRVPNVKEIGGLHAEIQSSKPLPEELKKFIDESKNGVILFSMGSNLKSADLPTEKRDGILKAFSKLKQNVIWKWETDNLPGQPKNVKIMKWVPQQEILAHPNTVAFVTHGGLQSTIESIYHGIPVIGIPIFADQKMNIATAVSYGYAITIPMQELNEETLTNALTEILYDSKYKENAQRRSRIMRDKPMKSLDEAIYWIEYVVRHQGAPHLKYIGSELAWYERCLLDVVVAVLSFIIFSVFILRRILKEILTKKPVQSKQKTT